MAEKRSQYISRFICRLALFLGGWLALLEGEVDSLGIGLAVALISTHLSMRLLPRPFPLRLRVLPRFIIYFLSQAFIGSVDVARRALLPRGGVNPAVVEYRCGLNSVEAQLFFVAVLGLLPGSLCVLIEEDHMLIHVIDGDMAVEPELQRLEGLVKLLFGLEERDG